MPHTLKLVIISAVIFSVNTQCVHANEPLAIIEGEVPERLENLLVDVLGEAQDEARSLAQARRRALKASESAMSVMRSQGYYAADVKARVVETATNLETDITQPPQAIVNISPGPQFSVINVNVSYTDETPDISQMAIDEISLKPGQPAVAVDVVAGELKVLNYLHANGYPDAIALEREVVVDYESTHMSVTYNLSSGAKTRFGDIKQTGTAKLAKRWPEMIAEFKNGDEFDVRKLNALSAKVVETGAFNGATAVLSDEATLNFDGTETRQILLNIDQGKLNTVSGELGFSTSDGSGVDLTYERRNFIGYAQTLKITAGVKTNQISLAADYNIPYALRVERALDLGLEYAREDTDAFEGDRVGATALITQKLSKRFKVGLGVGVEASQFKENGQDVNSYVTDVIGRAAYDSRDNLFEPAKGYLAEAELEPSYNFGEESGVFTTATLGGSTYYRLSNKLVLAGRAKVGTIFGGDLSTIPLNRRFFAGGGGSVRGYGYQTISPENDDGDLSGGRSISELSGELRYKGDSPIGFAAFIDAGAVSTKESPNLNDLRAGAGVGLRYYTSFAPIRADIAIPLDKREGDNAFQFYISVGQAF